jgi:hypothetical protein
VLGKRIVRLNTIDKASPRMGKWVNLHCMWGEVKMVLSGAPSA